MSIICKAKHVDMKFYLKICDIGELKIFREVLYGELHLSDIIR